MTLAAVAENHEQVTPSSIDSSGQPAQPAQKQPYYRLPGEPSLWWNRFDLYLHLGYKRTLLAALHKEQEKAKVLDSTQPGQKAKSKGAVPPVSTAATPRKNTKKHELAEVPQTKREQVPSSWKIAAQRWHWKERAQAWDDELVTGSVEQHLQEFLDGPALVINRVTYLKRMFDSIVKTYNANSNRLSFEQDVAYYARMQSILRDIKEEMKNYNEAVTRMVLQQSVGSLYKRATPEMLDLEAIQAEQDRRAQGNKLNSATR